MGKWEKLLIQTSANNSHLYIQIIVRKLISIQGYPTSQCSSLQETLNLTVGLEVFILFIY